MQKLLTKLLLLSLLALCLSAHASLKKDLEHLKQVYPGLFTLSSDNNFIIWNDGTRMPVQDGNPNKSPQEKIENPSLADQISNVNYPAGKMDLAAYFRQNADPGRIRYEPFARKMYGNSAAEVQTHITTIDWMPGTFKKADGSPLYQLSVTTVNQVDAKLKQISAELDTLVSQEPSYKDYLANPGGTFAWRNIANTNRLSFHSFGMTIDINVDHSSYWQWHVYTLYLKPSENAIKPADIPGKAVVLVKNRAYFVENHQCVMKDNALFTVDISLPEDKQKELAQLGITDGEVARNAARDGLINSIMGQALAHGNRPLAEESEFAYYPNQIPWPIILVFEKYGFIWGGKWHHFDTMHFEYRPELFTNKKPAIAREKKAMTGN